MTCGGTTWDNSFTRRRRVSKMKMNRDEHVSPRACGSVRSGHCFDGGDRIRAVGIGRVGAAAAVDRVAHAVIGEEPVVAGLPEQRVVAVLAVHLVVAGAAVEEVVAEDADEQVVAVLTVQGVGGAVAGHRVVAVPAEEDVGPLVADVTVVAAAADDALDVVGDEVALLERAVVGQGVLVDDREVLAARGVVGGVAAVAANEVIGAAAAVEYVVAALAEQGLFVTVAAATEQRVVAVAALDGSAVADLEPVGARRADQQRVLGARAGVLDAGEVVQVNHARRSDVHQRNGVGAAAAVDHTGAGVVVEVENVVAVAADQRCPLPESTKAGVDAERVVAAAADRDEEAAHSGGREAVVPAATFRGDEREVAGDVLFRRLVLKRVTERGADEVLVVEDTVFVGVLERRQPVGFARPRDGRLRPEEGCEPEPQPGGMGGVIDGVGPAAAGEEVIAGAGGERVVAADADERVAAIAVHQSVIARTTVER